MDGTDYLSAYLADPARDVSLLRRALEAEPDLAAAHFALSVRLQGRSDSEGALLELKRTLALSPHAAAAHSNLSSLSEEPAPARRAVLIDPAEALAQANLASCLGKADRPEEALVRYRMAIALAPGDYKICLDHGITLAEFGRRDQARAFFRRANLLDPRAVRPVRLLIELEKVMPDSPVLGPLARLAAIQARLSLGLRSELNFAIGKSLDDIGDVDNAFAALRTANALRRSLAPYDEATTLRNFAGIAALFPAPAIRAARAEGISAGKAVFIVGMPRSGSTLVEQILASHPEVGATGETKRLGRLMRQYGPASFAAVGQGYLAELARDYPDARCVTDKMLGNFNRLGFIAAALPGAKIIHVKRNPIACCLSVHSHFFLEGHPYAADLGELGRYYRGYAGLMAHWRQALPQGAMTEITYEDLVQDPRGQTRQLLDFLGLPWHEGCLDFHKTERMVRTASQAQVRRPLNRDGLARWYRYIPHIGSLIEALGPLADQDYKHRAEPSPETTDVPQTHLASVRPAPGPVGLRR